MYVCMPVFKFSGIPDLPRDRIAGGGVSSRQWAMTSSVAASAAVVMATVWIRA